MLKFKTRSVKIGNRPAHLVADFGKSHYGILSELFSTEYLAEKAKVMDCLTTAKKDGACEYFGKCCRMSATSETTQVRGAIKGVNWDEMCEVRTDDLLAALAQWENALSGSEIVG